MYRAPLLLLQNWDAPAPGFGRVVAGTGGGIRFPFLWRGIVAVSFWLFRTGKRSGSLPPLPVVGGWFRRNNGLSQYGVGGWGLCKSRTPPRAGKKSWRVTANDVVRELSNYVHCEHRATGSRNRNISELWGKYSHRLTFPNTFVLLFIH